MNQEKTKAFRLGPIRPPSEAFSLLLQVTQGCTWNKCKFCQLYRDTPFKAFSVDSIKEDIDIMKYYADLALEYKRGEGQWDLEGLQQQLYALSNEEAGCAGIVFHWIVNGGKTVFLQDGNTLALSAARLTEVLRYLRATFPQIERVTSYGRGETLAKVSAEEYAMLKEVGLDRIHSGFESGSDEVLGFINKGATSAEFITAGKNIKAGGIELSVYFMPGVGGKALSEKNALGMAHVVSEIDPDYVRVRTAVIKKGTELWEDYRAGRMKLCSDDDKIHEIKLLIENAENCHGRLVSDHIINLLQDITGSLNNEKGKMLAEISRYASLPEMERKMYQLARRAGAAQNIGYLEGLHTIQRQQLEKMILSYKTEEQWNERINEMMVRYI